ncbi:uncharacterized transmembrane protein DDB_G0281039-like [Drosophila rhopaloa]|uniref:Uncharacterized transmembrane protein DDB_G0281039-like n=1 Tax=Drosophila rhopaloa TaxID=1041015 RepID=A0A6P4EG29_DRORH|nr:uncharacterized transmembrane protein DDB_G0281039-like [Drosophila rhopaloa]
MQQHGGNMLQHNSNASSLLLDHSELGLVGGLPHSNHPDEGNHSLEGSNKSPMEAPLANSNNNNNNNNDNDDEDVID